MKKGKKRKAVNQSGPTGSACAEIAWKRKGPTGGMRNDGRGPWEHEAGIKREDETSD